MAKTFKPFAPRAVSPRLRRNVDSGLILPEELSRATQVWTKDEWRRLERLTIMLDGHGIDMAMRCRNSACKDKPLEPMRLPDGGFRLRCQCTDRVMTKAF